MLQQRTHMHSLWDLYSFARSLTAISCRLLHTVPRTDVAVDASQDQRAHESHCRSGKWKRRRKRRSSISSSEQAEEDEEKRKNKKRDGKNKFEYIFHFYFVNFISTAFATQWLFVLILIHSFLLWVHFRIWFFFISFQFSIVVFFFHSWLLLLDFIYRFDVVSCFSFPVSKTYGRNKCEQQDRRLG